MPRLKRTKRLEGDLSKPLVEMTQDELVHLCKNYEHLLQRVLVLSGELITDWPELSDAERLTRTKRAVSPAIIDPRPIREDALKRLRWMDQ